MSHANYRSLIFIFLCNFLYTSHTLFFFLLQLRVTLTNLTKPDRQYTPLALHFYLSKILPFVILSYTSILLENQFYLWLNMKGWFASSLSSKSLVITGFSLVCLTQLGKSTTHSTHASIHYSSRLEQLTGRILWFITEAANFSLYLL